MSAACTHHRIAALIGAAALSLGGSAMALPLSPVIAGSNAGPGGATFASTPTSLTVSQTASRVVIDWASFNIANGESVNFDQGGPDWIAFNRVSADPITGLSPMATLAGSLTAQGGVWLFSPGGIVIGSTAQIDVGSLALITAPLAGGALNQLLTPDANGLTTVDLDPPSGVGVEVITVQNGAQINAHAGYVALQSETIDQGGAISATDGVGYAVAETGQIQFLTSPTGQQLQSASVTLLVGQDRPSFSHTGSTNALWVGIDTPGNTLQANYNTLVGIGGSIVATGVKPDGSDNGVVLLVGDNQGPGESGYTSSSIGVDTSAASITATNGVYITSDNARLGSIQAGGPLDIETYGDIALTAPVSVGGSAVLTSVAGAVDLGADIAADQSLSISGQTITLEPGVTAQSDALGQGAGDITLSAAGDITADATSLLLAGSDPQNPTGGVFINAGTGAGGGDISLGAVSGFDVFIQAYSARIAGEGAITLAGPVIGPDSVGVFIDDSSTAGGPTGALSVNGAVSSAGFIDLENLGTGALVIGPGVSVTSSGNQVFLDGGGDTTVEAGASVTGVSILAHTAGELTIVSGASLASTGAPAPLDGVILPFGADYQRATGLNLAASFLSIQGTVTAGLAGARDDILIEILNTTAAASIGGDRADAGFSLTNADFGQLTGRNVVIMGGPGEASGPGVDLEVGDLTLDSSKISGLWLGTASSQTITIAGAVTSTGAAPVDVQIGFVRQGLGGFDPGLGGAPISNPNPGALDGFIPGEIDITGSLGSATSPLGQVGLIARNDIFMGSAAFIAAAAADPALDAVKASSQYAGETGAVFVAAASLQLSAQGRIIQQNTSAQLYGGLLIGAPTADLPLIAVPAGLGGQAIGAGDWTANYAAGPTTIDLFGTLTPAVGAPVSDQGAARLADLTDVAITPTSADRINACAFAASCLSLESGGALATAVTFTPPLVLDQTIEQTVDPTQPQAQFITTASAVSELSSDYAAVSEDIDSERLGSTNPVTESGNRELWTSQRKKRAP